MIRPMRLPGRVAAITGGALGIGRATALIFAAQVARVAFFLASDDASYVTGHTLAVDGGYLAGGLWSGASGIRAPGVTLG